MTGKILFISGIDTGIGKTVATGLYAKWLMQQGFSVITQKMVQTGCTGFSDDILVHRKIQGIGLTEDDSDGTTCPYLFSYPCSPHMAAALEGRRIEPDTIAAATQRLAAKYDYVLLEGAGGLAVPYNETETVLDHIHRHGYPVMLVTSGRLGSINHTLLSLSACQSRNIPVHTLAYNRHREEDAEIAENTKIYLQNHLARRFPETAFWEIAETAV
ncbi:dethiobiotin synthase [Neisseria sp.]|uniref:dethiobiotin synthase n=1 Tax=Neisseria sp. TaxID=192066 RepID=UPI00359FEA86